LPGAVPAGGKAPPHRGRRLAARPARAPRPGAIARQIGRGQQAAERLECGVSSTPIVLDWAVVRGAAACRAADRRGQFVAIRAGRSTSISRRVTGSKSVAVYTTSDFKKGLKVQIDGTPYLMIEMNFRKPGKGNALYECKMRNLLRGTVLDKTYRAGQTLESADVSEFTAQYLYKQGDVFVFMKNDDYEQYEMSAESVGDAWKFLKDNMDCQLMVFNNQPIAVSPPNHVILKVEYCEPGARGNTATNVTKPCKLETGAEILAPAFVNIGDFLRIDTRTGEYIERAKDPNG
jgi:elongation factor P